MNSHSEKSFLQKYTGSLNQFSFLYTIYKTIKTPDFFKQQILHLSLADL